VNQFERELQYLLDDICRDWGFCLRPDARRQIAGRDKLDSSTFAAAVLRAEGFMPEYEKKWMRLLMARFEEHFAASDGQTFARRVK
jgi:hypothetical protein